MNRTGIAVVIILLVFGGYACGSSSDQSGGESKVKGEIETLKEKASGEVKELEEHYKTLEAEKDYGKALEEEPKPPAGTMEGEGDLLGEEFEPLE